MDGTLIMRLFASQAETDKNSKITHLWYLYANIHSFREIVATQPQFILCRQRLQVPTGNFQAARSIS